MELGEDEADQDHVQECPEADESIPQGNLTGRWAAKADAEAVAALREHTPQLVERIVAQVLIRRGDAQVEAVKDQPVVVISLSRRSKKATPRWGFRWSQPKLDRKTFVVAGVVEESAVDRWNLKKMATGSAQTAVYPGDRLVQVNGEQDFHTMQQLLKRENELELHFARDGPESVAGTSLHDETDDEAEELRVRRAAEKEKRRTEFCDQSRSCFQALPEVLKAVFGASSSGKRKTRGKLALDLQDCLDHVSMVEALEDDYKPVYSCSTCKTSLGCRTFASRRSWLWPAGLPPLLTLQMKRFRCYAGKYVKSVTSVALPAELDLSDSVISLAQLESLNAHAAPGSDMQALVETLKSKTAGSACSLSYELYGLCEHQGSEMEDGHYVAYVNVGPSLSKEEWVGVSDAKLWKCKRDEVLKVEAYIAFYRRVDSIAKSSEAADHGCA